MNRVAHNNADERATKIASKQARPTTCAWSVLSLPAGHTGDPESFPQGAPKEKQKRGTTRLKNGPGGPRLAATAPGA